MAGCSWRRDAVLCLRSSWKNRQSNSRIRGSMENMWEDMHAGSVPMREVTYTLGIDIGENYVAPLDGPSTGGAEASFPASTGLPPQVQSASDARTTKGIPKRFKNFSIVEDEVLCSAYLNVSKDPIVGVNQPIGSYWARITTYFLENKRTTYDRTQSSLQHRWGDIQKDTSRFSGFFAEIERQHHSGTNENDTIKAALQMFEGVVGYQYKYLHCWIILRHEHKWNSWLSSMSGKVAGEDDVPAQGSNDATLPPRMERPVGRDRAKKMRSGSSSSSSSACLEVLQKISMDRIAYEERQEAASKEKANDIASRSDRKLALQEAQLEISRAQVRIQEEILALQKEDREERVMALDMDKMAPWVRDYYINKQKKIAQRSLSGDASSGPSGQ